MSNLGAYRLGLSFGSVLEGFDFYVYEFLVERRESAKAEVPSAYKIFPRKVKHLPFGEACSLYELTSREDLTGLPLASASCAVRIRSIIGILRGD